MAANVQRSDWHRTRQYNSLGKHPEIRQWNNFASKSSIASMPRFWRPKPRQNESRWQTPRIEPLEPLCAVVFCSSTPIGRASSDTANTCGDY